MFCRPRLRRGLLSLTAGGLRRGLGEPPLRPVRWTGAGGDEEQRVVAKAAVPCRSWRSARSFFARVTNSRPSGKTAATAAT